MAFRDLKIQESGGSAITWIVQLLKNKATAMPGDAAHQDIAPAGPEMIEPACPKIAIKAYG